MKRQILIGPFEQIIPMTDLPERGKISDDELTIIENGGILITNNKIESIGSFNLLKKKHANQKIEVVHLETQLVAIPGMIDAHTHICFSGSRANDYAMRNSGKSYLDIAKAGGGIWDTVSNTRLTDEETLSAGVVTRATQLLHRGITTIEVKSGYGLSVDEELKMLRAINKADNKCSADIIATCLAAHIVPKDYNGDATQYLHDIIDHVFPIMQSEKLSNRVDAFIEEGAYSPEVITPYLEAANKYNFDITIHADQFHVGGSEVAIKFEAISADHLEASTHREINLLAKSNTIATALPGASIGLGVPFTPARRILDEGGVLAIASDWNPGSAPMGDLLTVAAILGAFEKLSNSEVLAGITTRAAAALNLQDRGILARGKIADIAAFPTDNYKEILYHQGQLQPSLIWKNGVAINN